MTTHRAATPDDKGAKAVRVRTFQTGAERVRAGRPTATDEVVERLKSWLSTGRMVPGQRLTEADLSRDLGVSKGPVREAMQRLVAEGVIVTAPYRGYLVYRMTRHEVVGLFDIMELLDGLMARRAAESVMSGADTVAMRAAMDAFEDAHFEIGRSTFRGDENQLNAAMIALAGNTALTRMSDHVHYSVFPLQFRSLQTRGVPTGLLDLVRKFSRAILAGDAKAAEAGAKVHARALRAHILNLSDEWFEPDGGD